MYIKDIAGCFSLYSHKVICKHRRIASIKQIYNEFVDIRMLSNVFVQ